MSTQPTIEIEEETGWDMEDSAPVAETKQSDDVHIIKLPETRDKDGILTDTLSQVVEKHLFSHDQSTKAASASQADRLKTHMLDTLGQMPNIKAVVYQLGGRQVRVGIRDAYRAINKQKYAKICEYAPEFAREAFNASPVIKVDSPKVPRTAIKELQEWLEMGRAILTAHGVTDPAKVITFTNMYQPKTTTNTLRTKQNIIVREGLASDMPYSTVLTVGKV